MTGSPMPWQSITDMDHGQPSRNGAMPKWEPASICR